MLELDEDDGVEAAAGVDGELSEPDFAALSPEDDPLPPSLELAELSFDPLSEEDDLGAPEDFEG